jgi:hypothetical protein
MYIVRDKKTKEIIHSNPAPLSQNLSGTEVYCNFNSQKMEIGKTDGLLPEHFDINDSGEIVELTLHDLVEKGIVKLKAHEKVVHNKIVDKTVSELVKEGLLQLNPNQKIEKNEIVHKSMTELVEEGIVKLTPTQKIKGDDILEKSLSEQVKEGIIKLNEPFEYVDGYEIKRYSIKELIEKKLPKTKKQWDIAYSMLNDEIERKISEKYTLGYELKITKGYLQWIKDGNPTKDEREITYQNMQNEINKIKNEYKSLKQKLAAIKNK